MYKIDNTQSKTEQNRLNVLNLSTPWGFNSSADVKPDLAVQPNDNSFIVSRDNDTIGYIDNEAKDIYDMFKKGYNISKTAIELYPKYKNSYTRFGLPSFKCKIMDTALKMEQLGLLERVGE